MSEGVPRTPHIDETIHALPHHDEKPSLPSFDEDKKSVQGETSVKVDDAEEFYDIASGKPLAPIEGPAEPHQLTARALVIGCGLGCLVAASNVYLGLKTGFTFGASLFGAIFGFAIAKALAKVTPHFIPTWLGGGYFGPKENVTIQTAATAAGSMSGLYVAAVPAMYQLGVMGDPSKDFGKLITFCLVQAYFGVFFAIPLRKYYILKQKLIFPTPTATALTIHSLHQPHGEEAAQRKVKWLGWSFIGALLLRVLSSGAPGILWDWHIFWWLWTWGWNHKGIAQAESWGWLIELTPAFFGNGLLVGLNPSYSFFGGSVLAWAIIGPLINGQVAFSSPSGLGPAFANFQSMSKLDDPVNRPSPRYWLLWPGVLLMLVASFVEIFMNGKMILSALRNAGASMWNAVAPRLGKRTVGPQVNYEDEDPTTPEERVPLWAWIGGLLAAIILTCVVMGVAFDVGVGLTILALVMGFIFAFIGIESSGRTDVNPLTACAKASQLVFGGVTKNNYSTDHALRVNLLAGSIASSAASHSVDMIGDLRTGHLLGVSPYSQFIAQCVASIVGCFISTGLAIVFFTAYPCIITGDECKQFSAPSVAAWVAVAKAVVLPHLPVPPSSGYTAIGLSVAAAITIVAKHTIVPERYRGWVPNWNAIGLAFVVPQPYYSVAMIIGSTMAYFWKRRNPSSFDAIAFSLAAGMIAGEGIGGVINAAVTIGGGKWEDVGSAVGCPGNKYCG